MEKRALHLQNTDERRTDFLLKKPPSKFTNAGHDVPASDIDRSQFQQEMRQPKDDPTGMKAARRTAETARSAYTSRSAYRSYGLKPFGNLVKAGKRLGYANVSHLQEEVPRGNFQPFNSLNRQRKRAVKKQHTAGPARRTTGRAGKVANTIKAAQAAARRRKRKASTLVRCRRSLLIAMGLLITLALFLHALSSCSILPRAGRPGIVTSAYPSSDEAMLGAEAAYAGREAELQNEADHYKTLHPGYDKYCYDLDEIGHDPYVLISLLTAWHGGKWTLDEVQDTLSMLFEKQYQLTQTVDTEVHYRTESGAWTDAEGGQHTGPHKVPYQYSICNVKLHNENLSHLPMFIMSEKKVGAYARYMSTLGERPDLFPTSSYPNASMLREYTDYAIPAEALKDRQFAAMILEAKKYLGYPYVWGGSNPTTSFDCSGFVSWVLDHSGWDMGHLGAQGLYKICIPIPASDAKPGDLVFFEHTYDTDGVSHVGIYVGDGMMIHCGNPISYASIETSYWQNHLYAFCRLPEQ